MIPLIGGTPIDRQLHVGGTGVMSFKGGCIPTFDLAVFKYINMTDVWLSLWAGMLKIPIIRPKSRDRWIGISKKFDSNHSISALISDEIHTEAINNVKWNNI
jgi:hypothetical protein